MTITYTGTQLAPANNQLAAFLTFRSDTPVFYRYSVLKRTTSPTSIDFRYVSTDLITNIASEIAIPVIGLYASYLNEVQVIFTDESGNELYNHIIPVSTKEQTYRDATIFHLDIRKADPARFSSIWGNSWLMTTFCDGYDQNGDLRCYYQAPYRNQMLKTHNRYFYIGAEEDIRWYGHRFFKIDILGHVIVEYDLRDSDGNRYTNTHDLAWDAAGALYMTASDSPDRSTNTMRQDAWLLKFDDQTGKMIWAKNYTSAFDNTDILNNSGTNDVHLNSLSWIPAGTATDEAIIVHSRSASLTFGVSTDDGHILWSADTGGYNALFPSVQAEPQAIRLDTAGITRRENGAHSVFVTNNSTFSASTDAAAGKFVLSLFNNNSCISVSDNQSPVHRPISETATAEAYHTLPAEVLFYAVDLTQQTVTQLGEPLTLPATPVAQITDFMGAVFDYRDCFSIFTNMTRSFFISDLDGNKIATIYDVICTLDGYPAFPGECYRARLFAEEELTSLITTAFAVHAG